MERSVVVRQNRDTGRLARDGVERMCNTFGVASHDPHGIVYSHALLLHEAARDASTVKFRVRPWAAPAAVNSRLATVRGR